MSDILSTTKDLNYNLINFNNYKINKYFENTLWARAFKNSLYDKIPETGFKINPVSYK